MTRFATFFEHFYKVRWLADGTQGAWALMAWSTAVSTAVAQSHGRGGSLAKDSCAQTAHLLRSTATQEVHNHHDHEEKIFFPWMETKVKLPPKMSADHKTLIANLDDVGQDRAAACVPLSVVR